MISSIEEGLMILRQREVTNMPSLSPSLAFALNGTEEICKDNIAGIYPCMNINLHGFLDSDQLSGSANNTLNDLWGWTDPVSNMEYALVGLNDGTAFVNITVPESPSYLGFLESHNNLISVWRDIKTYGNFAYIVADVEDHGMQIFDLTELRAISNTPVMFNESAHFEVNTEGARKQGEMDVDLSRFYDQADLVGVHVMKRDGSTEGYVHNIAINEESGFAYLIGSSNCGGGLYMLNITDPLSPSAAGCFSEWGWISDAQCITYDGPDVDHLNSEICFVSYLYGFAAVDVTDKSNPEVLSFLGEAFFNNIEQGWLTEDKRYFLLGDRGSDGLLRTYMVDVTNLDNIGVADTYESSVSGFHSNMFVVGNYVYQGNHRGGLRILDLSNVSDGVLVEVGYFDTTPTLSGSTQDGVWGVYPFYNSGIVILGSADEGLFIVRATEITTMPSKAPSSYPFMFVPSPSLSPSSVPSLSPIDTTPTPLCRRNIGLSLINLLKDKLFHNGQLGV